ncbi:zinc finger protein 64 homolog, isoforms 1 and 2-like isoform X1 [Cephus cinctus]|uniref:Zinc finger protein 64 homolog, isoforms 1 and 2-like isoform X1 n=1 Tax=Cephus cinctus TaxID=211228 RepID=A0AAJ7RB55_CEPCN|nr:zinc finger protein 64 homolog, isoforms 1 and 2-like isoform X1 [Cephus cinctus]
MLPGCPADYRLSTAFALRNDIKFPCPKCSSIFNRKNNLYNHLKFECGQSPRFSCRYVDFTTFQATAVGGLVLSKSIQGENIKHACANCPSVFNQRHNLRHHIKFQCGQLPRFNCPYCHYRTRHSSNARAHIRRKHPGSKVYAIDVSQILD